MAGGQPVETTVMWTPKGERKVVNTSEVEKYRTTRKWSTEQPKEKV
jgi:hypothetical protein